MTQTYAPGIYHCGKCQKFDPDLEVMTATVNKELESRNLTIETPTLVEIPQNQLEVAELEKIYKEDGIKFKPVLKKQSPKKFTMSLRKRKSVKYSDKNPKKKQKLHKKPEQERYTREPNRDVSCVKTFGVYQQILWDHNI